MDKYIIIRRDEIIKLEQARKQLHNTMKILNFHYTKYHDIDDAMWQITHRNWKSICPDCFDRLENDEVYK